MPQAKHTASHKRRNIGRKELIPVSTEKVLSFQPPPRPSLSPVAQQPQEGNSRKYCEMQDRLYHAALGQMAMGFSPDALALAYTDWFVHLMLAPYRQADLLRDAHERAMVLYSNTFAYLIGKEDACYPEDTRFSKRYKGDSWKRWPYNIMAQAHLTAEDWWQEASHVRGMTRHHQDMIGFFNLLVSSALSPENSPLLSPEIRDKSFAEHGLNYLKGLDNALDDIQRWLANKPPAETDHFKPGINVAVTEGEVIFRNTLFELIQYAPKTEKTYPEPVLIIPAWIMKYYILDLSPHNSMVRYLVEQGHTVFMISWKNPDARYRNTGFTDYLKEGALEALNIVQEIIPNRKVHAVGYCIGGTLLAMLTAHLANKRQDPLQTVTLFAAQIDFAEAGRLMTFIDEAQLTYLEDVMYSQGYLRGDQISAAFDLLQPRELIWHRIAQKYLMGERPRSFDLMAWDKDTTRLPYRMHSQYLREFYLHNTLAEYEFEIDDEVLDMDLVATPMFVVSTENDHIAPWKSVYKIHYLTDTEVTFVLANRGHNGGIISEPGHEGREFRIATREQGGRSTQAGKWMRQHTTKPGSWWINWHEWLAAHSHGQDVPPSMGNMHYPQLEKAPGTYVHEH